MEYSNKRGGDAPIPCELKEGRKGMNAVNVKTI